VTKSHYVKKARKDYPEAEIKKGETYYWFKLWRHPVTRSKVKPKQSQLVNSWYLQTVYRIEEDIQAGIYFTCCEDLEDGIGRLYKVLDWALGNCEHNLFEMPVQFRDSGPRGILLQDRIEELKIAIVELRKIEWINCNKMVGSNGPSHFYAYHDCVYDVGTALSYLKEYGNVS